MTGIGDLTDKRISIKQVRTRKVAPQRVMVLQKREKEENSGKRSEKRIKRIKNTENKEKTRKRRKKEQLRRK